MLRRLDGIPGVAESRVDWTGRFLLLALEPGADAAAAASAALALLGPGASRLDSAAASEQVEAFRRGERWMRAGETVEMSREEARVLARRTAERVTREEGLAPEEAAAVLAALDEALTEGLRRLHEPGAVPRGDAAGVAGLLQPVEARLRESLPEGRAARVAAALRRAFLVATGRTGGSRGTR